MALEGKTQDMCVHFDKILRRLFVGSVTDKSDSVTFLFRLFFFLGRLQVPRVYLFLKSFQFTLIVLKKT